MLKAAVHNGEAAALACPLRYMSRFTDEMPDLAGEIAIALSVNTWTRSLLVLKDPAKYTLPIGLSSLMQPYGNNYQLLIAGSVLSIVPIVVLFVSAQKYFIAGMTAGSIKG